MNKQRRSPNVYYQPLVYTGTFLPSGVPVTQYLAQLRATSVETKHRGLFTGRERSELTLEKKELLARLYNAFGFSSECYRRHMHLTPQRTTQTRSSRRRQQQGQQSEMRTVARQPGMHRSQKKKFNCDETLEQLNDIQVFTSTPGRKHRTFCNFRANSVRKLSITNLKKWMEKQLHKLL